MRQWLGSVSVAAAGLIGTVVSIATTTPWWVTGTVIGLTIAGAALTWPRAKDADMSGTVRETAFIRGQVSGATFEDVTTKADVAFDGGVKNSRFHKFRHHPKRGR